MSCRPLQLLQQRAPAQGPQRPVLQVDDEGQQVVPRRGQNALDELVVRLGQCSSASSPSSFSVSAACHSVAEYCLHTPLAGGLARRGAASHLPGDRSGGPAEGSSSGQWTA